MQRRSQLAAALAALIAAPARADAPLPDQQLWPGLARLDSNNSVSFAADIATETSGAIGLNMTAGDFNLQNNAAVLALIADSASSETYAEHVAVADASSARRPTAAERTLMMRNAVNVDISASGDIAGNVGLNAVSGAFNLQSNAVAIAAVPGSMLAQAQARPDRRTRSRTSPCITTPSTTCRPRSSLDSVSGNVGMNLASGVGNVQSNSITIARPF